jgi:hypothetical protein
MSVSKKKKSLFDDDDEDKKVDQPLAVNQDYAARFQKSKEKKELNQCEAH